ncbi:MAG: biotin--[acetyl-CoA-carboxylase] ligase [Desulfobulbaceae bacterium]|nr:biotin--[acetyl-CoA-carboxylase] ligase [Desulfobulbaceae bacterium]
MGITLTPALVRQLIDDEERGLRQRQCSPGAVDEIFRFGAVAGAVIERFDRLDRGMAHARQLINDCEEGGRSFASGTVILAGELTSGQGRFQRYWHAPMGGVWMTVAFANTLLPESTRLYPLAAGLACCEAVRHYGVDARIKWVNDIHVQGRKIAGILTETVFGPRHGEEYVLVGIGINANNHRFPPELAESAVSLCTLLGREVEIELLAARLLAKLAWSIGSLHYEERERLAADDGSGAGHDSLLVRQWQALSDTVGRRVLFGYDVQKNPQYEAQVTGITPDGGLLLRHLADNASGVEYSGEILYLD